MVLLLLTSLSILLLLLLLLLLSSNRAIRQVMDVTVLSLNEPTNVFVILLSYQYIVQPH